MNLIEYFHQKRNQLRSWFRTPTLGDLTLSREWKINDTKFPPLWSRPGIDRNIFEFVQFYKPEIVKGLEELLKEPDPKEMKRGHILKYDGTIDRFRRWFPVRLRAIRAREIARSGLNETDVIEEVSEVKLVD